MMARSALFAAALSVAFGAACGAASPKPQAPEAPAPSEPAAPREPPPPSGPPVAIECGDFTTCAVVEGGAVRCWGRDKLGELGDGGGHARTKSVPVPGVTHAKSVAIASQFACALLEDGKVTCWGTGTLANDGKERERSKPVVVSGVEGAVELVASGAIACARTPEEIHCWGVDEQTIGEPPKGELTNLAVGFTHACALDKKGRPRCWGTGDWGKKGAFSKPRISGARGIATGDRHACVITKSRKVMCWGMNDAGQLGRKPDTRTHKRPVTVRGVSKVARLVAGEASTCAIRKDGAVTCWGQNGEGELGLGERSSDERPKKAESLAGAEQLCIGSMHACAFTHDDKVLCWGANNDGQLGDGTKRARLEPAPIVW